MSVYQSPLMTYDAKLRVHFDTEWKSYGSGIYDDEMLPEEHYTFEIPSHDIRDEEDMRRVANEFDLVLAENHSKQVIQLENKVYALEREVLDLKAKLSRYENPDNPNYTEEEMEAMDYENK